MTLHKSSKFLLEFLFLTVRDFQPYTDKYALGTGQCMLGWMG